MTDDVIRAEQLGSQWMRDDVEREAIIDAAAATLMRITASLISKAEELSNSGASEWVVETSPIDARNFGTFDRLTVLLSRDYDVDLSKVVIPAALEILKSDGVTDEASLSYSKKLLEKTLAGIAHARTVVASDDRRITKIAETLIQARAEVTDYSLEEERECYSFASSYVLGLRPKVVKLPVKVTAPSDEELDKALEELVA